MFVGAAVVGAATAHAVDEKWEKLAKSPDRGDRYDAAYALAKDGSDDALRIFVRLLDDEDTWVRDGAIVACGHLMRPEQVARILPRAAAAKARPRADAADALCRTASPTALPAVRKLALEDRDAEVRRTALWGLEHFEKNPEAHAVAELAAADPDPTIRACAVYAAGRIRAPDALRVVDKALADTDDRVRAVAVYRMRWLSVPACEAALAKFASDASPRVRSTCAEVAWSLQTAPAMDVLVALVGDPDLRTAALAHRCLRHAARKTIDRDPQLWSSWWQGARAAWKPKQHDDPSYFWDDRHATKANVYGVSLAASRLAIVVDVSYILAPKLRGEDTTRWDEVRTKLLDAIEAIDDGAALNVIAAGDEVKSAFREPRALDASSRKQIRTFLDAQRPRGACDLWGAMRTAFDQPGIDAVLVVSFAERDAGDVCHDDRFFEAVQRRAEMTRAVVHTVWLTTASREKSESTAGALMLRMANDTMGRARKRTWD